MLKAERMSKLKILGPDTLMKKCIEKLHELNVYHIIEHKKDEELDIGSPLKSGEELSATLVKLRTIISKLDIKKRADFQKKLREKDYAEIKKKTDQLHSEISKNLEGKKELDKRASAINGELNLIEMIDKIEGHDIFIKGSNYIFCLFGFVKKKNTIKEDISKITSEFQIESVDYGRKSLLALFIEKEKTAQAQEILSKYGFDEKDLSSLKGLNVSLTKEVSSLKHELRAIETESRNLARKIERLKNKEAEFLLKSEAVIAEEVKKAEIPLKFGATRKSFMVTGYVPSRMLQKIRKELNDITNERICVTEEAVTETDKVPVKLKNSRIARPFEWLIKLYGLPIYREIDPTSLMFITFPLFFGIMLGDVGYGAATLAIFILLKKKLPSLKAFFNIMIFSSLITIAFGFVFGEYFGFEHLSDEKGAWLCSNTGVCFDKVMAGHAAGSEEMAEAAEVYTYDFPRLLNRMHGEATVLGYTVPSVLVIGALIGLIHINLSLLLGFYNELLAHGIKAAFLEKVSWIVMEAGAVLIVAPLLGMNINVFIGIAVFTLSLVLIYLGEGAKGVIELPTMLSNILSYTRLGAVGLASVGLAIVINERLTMPFVEKGGLFILLGIFILVLGHVINLALGLLGSFLHSTRLHYVEFFSRFYKGGGVKYVPFGIERES